MTAEAPAVDAPDVVVVGCEPLTWEGYERVVHGGARVALDPANRMLEHRRELEQQIERGAVIYAVNTGYGAEASRVIPPDQIVRMQENTLRATAVAVGEPVAVTVVRGMLLIKAQEYAQGPAALRPRVAELLVELLNRHVHPVVYVHGSQSASGDLIPNAHIGLALMGEGEVWVEGRRVPASVELPEPLRPAMKDGVGLTNDASFAAALSFEVIRAVGGLLDRAEVVAAMTLQALRGFPEAYDEQLVACRPHPGAITTARHMRELLEGSELLHNPDRRHDPYSLRCLPQVHGAVRDATVYARSAVETELRSVCDNPLVFPETHAALSGGNFHGAPLGIPLDALGTAVVTLAALSQRRTHHLVNPTLDARLPDKLAVDPSAQLGLLMANTAAASLVSECAALAAPASVTSIGVDPMEDHVSMAAFAAQKAAQIVARARRVVAIELLCAGQALDFQGVEHASGPVRDLHAQLRERMPFLREDRPLDTAVLEDLL